MSFCTKFTFKYKRRRFIGNEKEKQDLLFHKCIYMKVLCTIAAIINNGFTNNNRANHLRKLLAANWKL